jgi:hypothetical protein
MVIVPFTASQVMRLPVVSAQAPRLAAKVATPSKLAVLKVRSARSPLRPDRFAYEKVTVL